MNPEDNKNTADLTKPKNTLGNSFSSAIFYLSILIFIIGFNFSDRMAGNWYQQFMPNPSGGQIKDIYFIDSLTGFAVSDSSILKTSTSGDSWNIKLSGYYIFNRIRFINSSTGFASGGNNTLLKTTNFGENWNPIILPSIYPFDMSVVSVDSIWLVNTNSLTGGVFRTTNGGASWEQQFSGGTQNPNKIYMFNAMLGFMSNNSGSPNIYRTSNSGQNWNVFIPGKAFNDMIFTDSLKGLYCYDSLRMTTNGGINWQTQVLPHGGNFAINSVMLKFSQNDNDTIWGVGGYFDYGGNPNINRGVIYKTTNSGSTWGFQLPDTSFKIPRFRHVNFVNSLKGWAYNSFYSQQSGGTISTGVHTTTGGDTTLLPVKQISSEIPQSFILYQNYPNPFNPETIIKYQLPALTLQQSGTTNNKFQNKAKVKLIIYDITGKEIITLVNEEQAAGTYEVSFTANGYSSGIYFYSLIVDGKAIATRKMILLK